MADVVTPQKRSQMMAGIRGKNTKPELQIRRGLHRLGYRFRLHNRLLPGTPDIVLPKHKAVVFVHGCFWHGHDCHLFKVPATKPDFWLEKIAANQSRDDFSREALEGLGWRACVVWECALRGRYRRTPHDVETRLSNWLQSDEPSYTIASIGP